MIFKTIEPYYVAVSWMFIGFFIGMTGVNILPIIVEASRDGSYNPLFYSLSIVFGVIYFLYYKPFKLIIEDDKKAEVRNPKPKRRNLNQGRKE